MSFARYKKDIENGDLVILFLGYNNMLPLTVNSGETYQTRFGALRHNDIIGKKFGSKVKTAKGYLYVLHPDCELWTGVLPHRTQILYPVDIRWDLSVGNNSRGGNGVMTRVVGLRNSRAW